MSLNSQMIMSSTSLEAKSVGQVQRLRPAKILRDRPEAEHLNLVSLIDCFTILVAYLLVVTNVGTREIPLDQSLQLPVAYNSGSPSESTVVRLKNGQIMVDEKPVSANQLVDALELAKTGTERKALMIQADKNSDYEALNPLVMSGLQAGYEKIAFAVMTEGAK